MKNLPVVAQDFRKGWENVRVNFEGCQPGTCYTVDSPEIEDFVFWYSKSFIQFRKEVKVPKCIFILLLSSLLIQNNISCRTIHVHNDVSDFFAELNSNQTFIHSLIL